MDNRMLVLRNDTGVEFFRCKVHSIYAIEKHSMSIGGEVGKKGCTVFTYTGRIEVYTETYDNTLDRLGWTYDDV